MKLRLDRLTLPCLLVTVALMSSRPSLADVNGDSKGQKVYDFYCYQCHGYTGNARTLASTYLDPGPRNFSITDPGSLTHEQMVDAVTNGRPGTAMVSFTSVVSADEIEAVVNYIRNNFMGDTRPNIIYHTKENGWENHQRYAAAFPFANGKIPLDKPWAQLTEEQQQGNRLFMQSCISCHDRAVVTNEGAIWELRALSYPRRHYSHRMDMDSISSASPYEIHEQPPETSGLSQAQQNGAALFQQNCAFCHGADGTGKNWIGSFLEPHARDLTADAIINQATERLKQVIRDGLEGTSMPAWKHVLSDNQIDDVISYLKRKQND
jgi:cytochrome c oxidase cbb3-type subunit 3